MTYIHPNKSVGWDFHTHISEVKFVCSNHSASRYCNKQRCQAQKQADAKKEHADAKKEHNEPEKEKKLLCKGCRTATRQVSANYLYAFFSRLTDGQDECLRSDDTDVNRLGGFLFYYEKAYTRTWTQNKETWTDTHPFFHLSCSLSLSLSLK